MPSNKEIEFILTLKDKLTAKWNSTAAHIKNSAKDLAVTFQKYWASITAGWLAVSQLVSTGIDWAKGWMDQEQAASNFRRMVVDAGGDVAAVFERINAAAAGLVDDGDLYKAANYAMQMGIAYKDLPKLMEIARAKAREMNITVTESWEKLLEAIGAGRERGLKALGINADAKAAQDAYAESLGKTAGQLTKVEEQQALVNAVMIAGNVALARQNMDVLTLQERIQKLAAVWENIKDWGGEKLVRGALGVVMAAQAIYKAGLDAGRGVMFVISVFEAIAEKLGLGGTTWARDTFVELQKSSAEAAKNIKENWDAMTGGIRTDSTSLGTGVGMGWYDKAEDIKKTTQAVKELAVAVGDVQHMAGRGEGVTGAALPRKIWEIDEYEFARITEQQMEIGTGWDAVINGAQAGVNSLADSIMIGVTDAWEQMFGEANSLVEKFFQSVMAGIMEVLAMTASRAVVGGIFDVLGIGWLPGLIGLRQTGGESTGSGMEQIVSAIEKLALAPISGTVDLASGQILFRREMPDYEAWRAKKGAGELK